MNPRLPIIFSTLLIGLSLVLGALTTPVVASAQNNPAPAADQAIAAIDAYLETQIKELGIPGLALGIVQGDQIAYLKGFGSADASGRAVTAQTPFLLNSISKSFAALAIMQLVEQGKIELDAPVQRYLPWFHVADESASAQISVRHLLNHTSGLGEATSYEYLSRQTLGEGTLTDRVRRLSTVQLSYPVSTTFEYTDANYDVLGLVVETVAGQPYTAYVQQHILAPLEMAHTETTQPDALPAALATGHQSWFGFPVPFSQVYAHATLPSGDLISTAEDMTHYLIAQLNGGRYGDRQVLSSQGIAAMHQPAVPEGRGDRYYGVGWSTRSLNGIPVVRHDGTSSNFYADAVLDPAGRWGVVILLNFNSFHLYGGRIQALTAGILSLLSKQTPPILPAMHHPIMYPLLMTILLVTGLLLLWMMHSLWVWRHWQRQPARRPQGWRRGLAVGVRLVLPLLWALVLFVLVPQLTYPLAVLRINVPDFGYALLVSGVLGIGWALVWLALVLHERRTTQGVAQPSAATLLSSEMK
jgi:CubicO group peptidase (beta-lactamase class C family)